MAHVNLLWIYFIDHMILFPFYFFVLLTLFIQLQTAYDLPQYEVSSTLFPMMLKHSMGSAMIHQRLAH